MHRQLAVFSFAVLVVLASAGLPSLLWESQTRYFPSGRLDASSKQSDEFRNSWYSGQLGVMGEPVLKAGTNTHDASIKVAGRRRRAPEPPNKVRFIDSLTRSGTRPPVFATAGQAGPHDADS